MSADPLDLRGRRNAVGVVFSGIVAIWLVAIVFDLLEVRIASDLFLFEVDEDRIRASDERQVTMMWVQRGAMVVGAIVFIRWMHRAYAMTDAVSPGVRRYRTWWTIGGWLIPIMNWFRPKQIANDLWLAGDPTGEFEPRWITSGLILAWWAAWLLTNVVGNFVARALALGETLESYRAYALTLVAMDTMGIVAAVLAMVVVWRITARLEARAVPAPPAPEPVAPAPAAA